MTIVFVSFYCLGALSSSSRIHVLNTLTLLTLSLALMFSFMALTALYYLFDTVSYFQLLSTSISSDATLFLYQSPICVLNQLYLSLNPVSLYYFPFGYIFVLITILAILFCLSYNTNELLTFTFYCLVILSAGYAMFFTTSLLVFFMSYETLLVPSFYILYNFAKTRKCVEAAYLMFF